MPERLQKTSSLPPIKNVKSAIEQARNSIGKTSSEITSETPKEEVVQRIEAAGTTNARKLGAALRKLHRHVEEATNPMHEQMNLDLGDEK